jgi:Regulator of chromosome condensation (RCC1) repeat
LAVEDSRGVRAGKTLARISTSNENYLRAGQRRRRLLLGLEQYGELGNGNGGGFGDYPSVPVAVDTNGVLVEKSLTQISIGLFHTCALDSTGAAY